ncbi:MAG: hypothetical protein IJT53_02765 [Prevotella sp.]|nr:hypothetical protein [Prevotella sp.]
MYAPISNTKGVMAATAGHTGRRRSCSIDSSMPAKVVNSSTQSSMASAR